MCDISPLPPIPVLASPAGGLKETGVLQVADTYHVRNNHRIRFESGALRMDLPRAGR